MGNNGIMPSERQIVLQAARTKLKNFGWMINPIMDFQPFHRVYYEILTRFARGEIKRLIVQMPPQHGKAIKSDTPVLTTRGWKKHGELCVGDYVFGDDGKPKKVLGNTGIYEWRTMDVRFADGFSICCSHEHEWKIYSDHDNHKGRVEEIIEAQDIFKSKHRRSPYIKADAVINNGIKQLPIDPYILGLWLGDGYSAGGTIVSGEEDIEYYRSLPYGFDIRKARIGYYRMRLEGLTKALRVNNLLRNKHIPIDYLLASREQRMELLRGLMDTDGCCDKRGNCEFCQKSGRLADDVYVLLRTLGIKARKRDYTARLYGKDCGMKTRILFNPDRDVRIFRIPRKQARLNNKINGDRNDKKKFFIESITECETNLVNCIEVEGGMYLVGTQLVPTHNSQGSSRLLPAFMLGRNPDLQICIASYAATVARDFNRDVQRIVDSDAFREIFPDVRMNSSNVVTTTNYLRNSEVFEIVGHKGSLRVVGRGGSLTGKTVDVAILDDVYKDYAEGNSPIIREAAWKWYTTVVRTRLHNQSQEIIVFTRWHEDDIIGRLERSGETIVEACSWADLDNIPQGAWLRINFEALKESEPTELDQRAEGEALWEERHSRAKLEAQKEIDPVQFQCLFQGNPSSAEGRLYQPFRTWVERDEWGKRIRSGCYIDVADEGKDYNVAVTYDIVKSDQSAYNEQTRRYEPILYALVTDIDMTDEGTEVSLVSVPAMINRNGVQKVWVESNGGGSQYEKSLRKKVRSMTTPFAQKGNKESRILTASAMVNTSVIMPFGWERRYPTAYEQVTRFLRNFRANAHDDLPDVLTGIYEKEIATGNLYPYDGGNMGVTIR